MIVSTAGSKTTVVEMGPPSGVALRLFVTCWMLYVLHFATNTVREIYPALSLGDHLSFDVSEYVGFHPDIFEIPGRGAFINNNPGASIVGLDFKCRSGGLLVKGVTK